MEEKISAINHKGHKMLFADLSGMKEDEILLMLERIRDFAIKSKIHLQILDISNTNTTSKIKEATIVTRQEVKDKIGSFYTALLGLRLAQQIIANVISRDQYFASNLEDAKEYLVKKIEKQSK